MVFCNIKQSLTDSEVPFSVMDALLKSVARTFYLSLTYLPKPIREPMSLAYLLARLADTVVDAQRVPISLRRELLNALKLAVQDPANAHYFTLALQKTNACFSYFSNQDLHLLQSTELLLNRLQQQDSAIQVLIQEVLALIFTGQAYDLNYFDSHLEMKAFETDDALDQYLYWVAGSVGVFWTKLCALCIPTFSSEPIAYLLPKAVAFGKALQITNILRDLRHDVSQGRCYLPIPKEMMGGMHHSPDAFIDLLLERQPTIVHDWRAKALLYLEDAKGYANAMTERRIRFSAIVPMQLAYKTLFALPEKISKTAVYLTLFQAILQTWSPKCRVTS